MRETPDSLIDTSPAAVADFSPDGPMPEVAVERISYHGWPDCYRLASGLVEAVVVPAIGRVMGMSLIASARNAFWENRELDGQLHGPDAAQWMNFGGDKCWPAPQSDWLSRQGRDWPPPPAFDAQPMQATGTGRGVTLTSSLDHAYGIQVVRHVELDRDRPAMRIRTGFHKLQGRPVRVSIWTVTQMPEPERVAMALPAVSKLANGYACLMDGEPANLRLDGRLLSFARSRRAFVKIGTDGRSMAWIGPDSVVRMDVERRTGEYPDGGCATEIYTNPDPLNYVELETLGPLETMAPGGRIELTTTYTLLPRSTADPEAEARRVLFPT